MRTGFCPKVNVVAWFDPSSLSPEAQVFFACSPSWHRSIVTTRSFGERNDSQSFPKSRRGSQGFVMFRLIHDVPSDLARWNCLSL